MKKFAWIALLFVGLASALPALAEEVLAKAEAPVVVDHLPHAWVSHQWETITYDVNEGTNESFYENPLAQTIAVVPEPGTLTLLGLGITGVLLRRRMKGNSQS